MTVLEGIPMEEGKKALKTATTIREYDENWLVWHYLYLDMLMNLLTIKIVRSIFYNIIESLMELKLHLSRFSVKNWHTSTKGGMEDIR